MDSDKKDNLQKHDTLPIDDTNDALEVDDIGNENETVEIAATVEMPSDFDEASDEFNAGFIVDGKYRIVRKIGQGGMGVVYLALQESVGRLCALKIIKNSLLESKGKEKIITRFRKEAMLAASIHNEHIINIYDLGEDKELNFNYIAMEYVDGMSCQEMLRSVQRFTEDEALVIISELVDVLIAADMKHIVHRDIKPDNIMLSSTGEIKLMDLGIAKQTDVQGITMTHNMIGTPAYVSPEQAMDAAKVDIRADIYSLGVTMYQFVTGQLPYSGNSEREVIGKQINASVPNPKKLVPELSVATSGLIQRMMAKKADGRFASANELADYIKANCPMPSLEERSSVKMMLYNRSRAKFGNAVPYSPKSRHWSHTMAVQKSGSLKFLLIPLLLILLAGGLYFGYDAYRRRGNASVPEELTPAYYDREYAILAERFEHNGLSMQLLEDLVRIDNQFKKAYEFFRDMEKSPTEVSETQNKFLILRDKFGNLFVSLMIAIDSHYFSDEHYLQELQQRQDYALLKSKVEEYEQYLKAFRQMKTRSEKHKVDLPKNMDELEHRFNGVSALVSSAKEQISIYDKSLVAKKELEEKIQTLKEEWTKTLNRRTEVVPSLMYVEARLKSGEVALLKAVEMREKALNDVFGCEDELNALEKRNEEISNELKSYETVNGDFKEMSETFAKEREAFKGKMEDSEIKDALAKVDVAVAKCHDDIMKRCQDVKSSIIKTCASISDCNDEKILGDKLNDVGRFEEEIRGLIKQRMEIELMLMASKKKLKLDNSTDETKRLLDFIAALNGELAVVRDLWNKTQAVVVASSRLNVKVRQKAADITDNDMEAIRKGFANVEGIASKSSFAQLGDVAAKLVQKGKLSYDNAKRIYGTYAASLSSIVVTGPVGAELELVAIGTNSKSIGRIQDASGFSFKSLQPGRYLLKASLRHHADFSKEINLKSENVNVSLALEPEKYMLTLSTQGNAKVIVQKDGKAVFEGQSDANGLCQVPGLVCGAYTVNVSKDLFLDASVDVQLQGDQKQAVELKQDAEAIRRRSAEDAERKKREEAERIRQEEEKRKEAERIRQEEENRKEAERKEAERKKREEAERIRQEEEKRKEAERKKEEEKRKPHLDDKKSKDTEELQRKLEQLQKLRDALQRRN